MIRGVKFLGTKVLFDLSQSHGMVCLGKDLKDPLVPHPATGWDATRSTKSSS